MLDETLEEEEMIEHLQADYQKRSPSRCGERNARIIKVPIS